MLFNQNIDYLPVPEQMGRSIPFYGDETQSYGTLQPVGAFRPQINHSVSAVEPDRTDLFNENATLQSSYQHKFPGMWKETQSNDAMLTEVSSLIPWSDQHNNVFGKKDDLTESIVYHDLVFSDNHDLHISPVTTIAVATPAMDNSATAHKRVPKESSRRGPASRKYPVLLPARRGGRKVPWRRRNQIQLGCASDVVKQE